MEPSNSAETKMLRIIMTIFNVIEGTLVIESDIVPPDERHTYSEYQDRYN